MRIVIIGNGISGITAATNIRKQSDHEVIVISSETDYFISRPALMYVYMGQLKEYHLKPYEDHFWKKNRIELVNDHVTKVNKDTRQVILKSGKNIIYDKLIIATGGKPSYYGWKGQDLQGVQGLYSLPDLRLLEENTRGIKSAIIIGGGLIGVELAEMLHSRNIHVTFLVKDNSYMDKVLPKEESEMVSSHIRENGIEIMFNEQLDEIIGKGGKVSSVRTISGKQIPCEMAGITTGVKPNIEFVTLSGLEFRAGVLVNEFLQTSDENIYAIGDCAEFRNPTISLKRIEQLWYTGKMQGEVVACSICKGVNQAYKKDVFFNSAKFFDIEYQVYGDVPAQNTEEIKFIFYKDPKSNRSIRIAYSAIDKSVKGFTTMGIRYRQEVCTEWIRRGESIDIVVRDLDRANFDPEFFQKYENELKRQYHQQKTIDA